MQQSRNHLSPGESRANTARLSHVFQSFQPTRQGLDLKFLDIGIESSFSTCKPSRPSLGKTESNRRP
jgi:hypothetical protein